MVWIRNKFQCFISKTFTHLKYFVFILFVYVKIHFFSKIVGFATSFMQIQGLLSTTNKINIAQ